MNWGQPNFLFLLWAAPVFVWLRWHHLKKSRDLRQKFLGNSMMRSLSPQLHLDRFWLKTSLWIGGFVFLVLAAAQPRFGVYFETVTSRGADLVVCLDVSRSMLATDVAPNRLEHAKSDILDVMSELEGDRIGLVVFAGRPVTACPLTSDQAFFQLALRDVGVYTAPRGGTMIGDSLRRAMEILDADPDRDQAILLITDGEDHDSLPMEAGRAAAERGIKIFTVGLGDPQEGARIPAESQSGDAVFIKHEGQEVWSKLDESILQKLALLTGGAYVPATTRGYDLGEIYRERLAQLRRSEMDTEERKRFHERYQIFAAAGFLLFALHFLVQPYNKDKMRTVLS